MDRRLGLVALFVFTLAVVETYGRISCKDMNGNDVDWYYVYKVPNISRKDPPLKLNGSEYYYLDNIKQNFSLSKKSLENLQNPLAQTLSRIFKTPNDTIAFLVYNDQKPGTKESSHKGHTKGVVSFDDKTGYWLIHSIPRFPDISGYKWPVNAYRNGQSALCVTFNVSDMESIAQQMLYTYPNVYNYSLPPSLVTLASTFQDVVNKMHAKGPQWTRKVIVKSLEGQEFIHYAKFTSYGQDLYSGFVAPDIKDGMFVESWRWAPGHKLHSNCSGVYPVFNIMHVTLPGVDFPYRVDHSKWAITDTTKRIICIGDINRMPSQFKRAGGTMCTTLPQVWRQYREH